MNEKREYKLPMVLEKLLNENHITQSKLADDLMTSGRTVSQWINEKCMPSLFYAMAMAKYFGVTVEYLYYGE